MAQHGLRVGRPARSPARARTGRPGAACRGRASAPSPGTMVRDRHGPGPDGILRTLPGRTDRQAQPKTPPPTAEPCHASGAPRLAGRIVPPPPRFGAYPTRHPRLDPMSRRHVSCRRRPHPPSPRAPARCSGGEEARELPVPQRGAQRASSVRPFDWPSSASRSRSCAFGGMAANPTPAAAAGMKVVIIVGPAGSSTSNYISNAKKYASQARSYGATVIEIYSPNATWARVKAAAQGANVLIYLGHGNGSPSPYGAFNKYSQGRVRPQHDGRRTGTPTPSIGASGTSRRTSSSAPNAVVILNRLCYASGNSEWGAGEPDAVGRQAAHRQLRRRLPAHRRPGRVRRRHHQRLVRPVRDLQDEPHDRHDLPELLELERRPRLPVPVGPQRPVTGRGRIRMRRAATTDRSSATWA